MEMPDIAFQMRDMRRHSGIVSGIDLIYSGAIYRTRNAKNDHLCRFLMYLSVTIFTLHRTFLHSCLYLPLVAGRSLYTVISSYLSITTYCLLRRSNAQSAYLCTARLPTCSLLVQYIRTLWTLTFSS